MRWSKLLLCAATCMAASACATVIEGTTDVITVSTTPPGARCDVTRDGMPLGTIPDTPGSLNVSKSKNGLVITCTKPSHEATEKVHMPNSVATTFGNFIAGGVIGVVVDMSTGANFRYPPLVELVLVPADPPAGEVAKVPEPPAGSKAKAKGS